MCASRQRCPDGPSTLTRGVAETEAASATVLVVDDDPQVGSLAGAYLKRLEYDVTVVVVRDPRDALARFEVGDVDCVVSDYEMPAMDGLELLAAVREADAAVPFVLFTAADDESVARCARERDAAYLDAPLTWGGPGEYTGQSGPAFTMFVGGDRDTYERVEPVLDTLVHTHEHFGPVGHGQVVKAGHRLRQNCMAALDAELVEFYRNNGVDPAAVDDLLGWGVREALFDDEYDDAPGFEAAMTRPDTPDDGGEFRTEERAGGERLRTTSFNKDMAYALAIARSSETATPIASAAFQVYQAAEAYGAAVRDRDLAFQDPGWTDREAVVSEYRRRNRPAAEWRRLRRASDGAGGAVEGRSGDERDSEDGGPDRA